MKCGVSRGGIRRLTLKEETAVDNIALAQKILEISEREFALVVDFRDGQTTGTAIRTANDVETALAGAGSSPRLMDGQENERIGDSSCHH